MKITKIFSKIKNFTEKHALFFVVIALTAISIYNYIFYYKNGLGLAYNDARSHLDIGRRVVEGLKPGLAQIGSVWLPLPHLLMVPTIWNDFMWHSGLSGAIESMISFVATGALVYKILEKLKANLLARLAGVAVFALNLNILYLQSTAMTELLLLATLTAGVFYFIAWYEDEKILDIIKSAFYIMLSSLIRYEGWFLIGFAGLILGATILKKKGYKTAEGILVLFGTLAGIGIVLWLLWNQLIFKDALYFAIGPFSAHEQQLTMEKAGNLPTKRNILLSIQVYLYSLIYNTGAFTSFLGLLGAIVLWFDKKMKPVVRVASLTLLAPLIFNVLALYFGFSVLFIQGISGNTWFNVRYGIMMMPSIAVFIGYLVHKAKSLRWVIIGLFLFTTFFMFANFDSVAVDDARVGSSQKNVSEVSGWLKDNAANKSGFILISAASHDAIIFSSDLPMSKFIHEGTGAYWESATTAPDRWARWIVMRTYDEADLTYKAVNKTDALKKYNLVAKYPFADVYEIKPEFLKDLNRESVFGKQK